MGWALALLIGFVGAPPTPSPEASQDADLAAGIAALSEFRTRDAIRHLEKARLGGPHSHRDHVRLYEQLGIAYAYVGDGQGARAAFRTMLALDPSAAISYTLSPKVTFIFEEVRRAAQRSPRPQLDVRWPRDLRTDQVVPLDLEVIADPERFLRQGKVMFRRRGEPTYRQARFQLPNDAESPARARVELDATSDDAGTGTDLEVFVVAEDQRGNEVFKFGSADRPRALPLAYVAPPEWYEHWWVWAIVGSAVVAGASVGVWAATQSPPETVEGRFVVVR